MKPEKTTVEMVAEMAARGVGAREISDELGVSRQRVYQIAQSQGIELPRSSKGRRPAGSALPKARLITGGVQVQINHSVAGTISELLVAADLMARGWQVFMPVLASKGHDLIAVRGERLITIEVRSAFKNANGKIKFAKKADCGSAYYALVVTGEPISYQPDLE